jgi:hypothetical protein
MSQLQHGINTRKQVAHAACSLDRIASKCRCWGEESLRRPFEKHIVWLIAEVIPRQANLPRAAPFIRIPSRFPAAVPGPESRGGSAGRTSTLYDTGGGDQYLHNIIWCIPPGERESSADLVTERARMFVVSDSLSQNGHPYS